MPLRQGQVSAEQRETSSRQILSLHDLPATPRRKLAVKTIPSLCPIKLTLKPQAPFQWATIFHKSDINFTHGHHDLGWYDPTNKDISHHLPCKVSCSYCRTPIMDEGRNMILLFPTLINEIGSEKGRKAFAATCHMFYNQRVVDFIADGAVKWEGLDNHSNMLDDHGNVLVKWKEGMEEDEMDKLKRKRMGEIEAEKPETGKKTYKGPKHEVAKEEGHNLRSQS